MSTNTENVQGFHAVASVTGGNPATYNRQRGFTAAIIRTGVGDHTFTMTEGLDLAGGNGVCLAGLNAALGGQVAVEPLAGGLQLRVRTFDAAGVAAERSFWLALMPIGPN
jgi:hypothetical protein